MFLAFSSAQCGDNTGHGDLFNFSFCYLKLKKRSAHTDSVFTIYQAA